MDDRTKCEIYTKLVNSLNKNGQLKEEITKSTYNNQIRLIKIDLSSKVNSDQETALQMLTILIENNVQDIQRDVITILSNDSVDQKLKISILDSVRNYLKDLLQSNNIGELALLYVDWKKYDLQKFYELLENTCVQETQDDSQRQPCNFANLLIDHFLPMISSPNTVSLKEPLIQVATKIAEIYPVSSLGEEEYQEFLKKVPGFLTELVNLQNSNENSWREALHFLTKYLDEKLYSPEVQEMFNKSSLNWSLVQCDLESSINIELMKIISEYDLVMLVRLFNDWNTLDPQKFTPALREVCQDSECSKYCKIFLYDKLIPVIMATKDMCDPMKVYCIQIALEFASALPIARLSTEEYNKFIVNVNDYIKNISDLRDMNYEHWHKLWMFLVRLFGKKLHHSMSLVNKLLRVVEHAFRNSCYEQRLRGYDCWKELIDNVSLDSHHISSEKQIRLLLTPLRAKFSKQEAVIIKRFEVFVYLIEKLQDKAVLVLKEFLEFCFGEVGEDTDPNKAGQGKSLPELWPRSAKVLLAILGHSHDSSEHCLDTSTEICLMGPVLNSNNISSHYCHAINSVAESCILLRDVELDHGRHTVLKCFWASLLGIVLDNIAENKEKCSEIFGKVFNRLLKENDPYCNSIAAEILKSTIKCNWSKASPFVLINLEYFNKIIFSVPLNKESYLEIEKFQIMLCTLESPEATLKIINNLFDCFANYKTVESNANFIARFWIFLVNELDEYAKNKCLNFLVWPALYIHHVTDSAKTVLIYEHYRQIVLKFVEKSDELQLALFKNFEKILKINPLLSKNVLTLVTMFAPKTGNKELTNITLEILDLMMVVAATQDSSNQRQDLDLYLKKFYESNVTDIHNHDTIKKLCTCVQHILKFKNYDILNMVVEKLKYLPEDMKWVHGKYLSLNFLMDLFEKETDVYATEKIHKLIEVFRNVKNPEAKKDVTSFMPLGGRSAKIAKLVKQIPPSPSKRSDSPTTLRLFGKDIDTHSPLKVKGSKLKDTPTKAKAATPTQKPKKPICIDAESNTKFVLIESEVKLDKTKLTEHQRETLRKRREDIPALYQDLSQSMTQSLDSNSASRIEESRDVLKKPGDSKEIEQSAKSLEYEKNNCAEVSGNENNEDTAKLESKVQEPGFEIEENQNEIIGSCEKNKELNKEELKKAAVEAELKKLSMSIVGAEAFVSATSKRKRREKKRDHEEDKEISGNEKQGKGLATITPKADKSSLSTLKQTENTNEIPIVEDDDRNKTEEVVQVKTRGRSLTKKNISNTQNADSPATEETVQCVTATKSENHSVTIRAENTPETSTEIIVQNTKEVDAARKVGRPKKKIVPVKDWSETCSKEEGDNEAKRLEDHNKVPVEDSTELNINKIAANPVQPSSKEERCIEANISENHKLPTESSSTKENTSNTSKLFSATEIDKPDNKPEDTEEVRVLKKRGRPVGTPNRTKKRRGWPLGVRRSTSGKRTSSEISHEIQSSLKNKLKPQSETLVKITCGTDVTNKLESIKSDMSSCVDKDGSFVKAEKGIDTEKQRRGRGRPKKSPRKDFKRVEKIAKTDPTELDIYHFDTEQERVSESEIVPLRSPIKENKLALDTKESPKPPELNLTPKEKNKHTKRSIVISDTPNLEVTPPSGKRSKRKSIPTEKITQSELFKQSDPATQTPSSLKTQSSTVSQTMQKGFEKHNVAVEKTTQSEIFKRTNEEITYSDGFLTLPSKLTQDVKVSKEEPQPLSKTNETDAAIAKLQANVMKCDLVEQSVDTLKSLQADPVSDNNPKSSKKLFGKAIKRKRPSSEDDEDIIESSQDSTVSNITATKLKLSLTKRPSFDKVLTGDIGQNIEEVKKDEDHSYKKQLNQTDKINTDGTPEEKKQKRVRPARSPTKSNSSFVDTSVYEESHDKVYVDMHTVNKSIIDTQIGKKISELETTPEEKRQRRRNPVKSPSKILFTETSVSVDKQKHDKLTESENDNDTDKVEVPSGEKKQRRIRPTRSPAKPDISIVALSLSEGDQKYVFTDLKPHDKPGEQTQSNNDTTKIDTSPEERKDRKIRRKKSPARSDDLFDISAEHQNSETEGVEESQSLVTISGKSSSISEGKNPEDDISKRPRCKSKEDFEISEPAKSDLGESELKRKRRRKNAKEIELSEETDDGDTPGDSTVHIMEATEKTSSGTMTFDEMPQRSRRNSLLKAEKESNELIQEIMQKVKKQIFPEKFKKSTDLNTFTQNPKHRIQSQDTQTQDSDLLDINDDAVQLQLDLPQKSILNETDKEFAIMDTASLSLGNLEESKCFDVSSNEETRIEINRITMENKTLMEDIAESINIIGSCEETIDVSKSHTDTSDSNEINFKGDLPETENIVCSKEDTKLLTESREVAEVLETEELTSEVLSSAYVQMTVEVECRSPVNEQTAGNCVGAPGSLESSLPSSPVTGDTPNRTSELLNCTSDISPIGSKSGSEKSSSDDEFVEQRKLIPVALKFDNEDPDHEVNKEKSPEKADDAPEKIAEMSPEKAEKNVDKATSSSPPKDEARTSRDVKNIAERSSKFFDMVKGGSPATNRLFNKRKSGLNMSPSASRIRKLLSNVKAPSQSEITENVNQEDILTFSREVPSPLAVPRSSILKRKHSDSPDDGMSPCAKRKRVNFSDPCTTSKKLFIKEDNASQGLFGANIDDDLDQQFLEVLAANNIIDSLQTESDNIETQQSLQINNPLLLRDDIPIYPDLVDCEESVSVISRKLTSPMFVNALLSKLNSKNIKTIGDLAKQSEISIARLPFKTPMVANVYKALDNYYHKNFKSKANKDKHETKVNGEQDTANELPVPLRPLEVALVKMNVKDELLKVLERARCQNMSAETICSLLFSAIDQKEILTYVKTHFNLETKDIVDEEDFPKIVKHITESVGLPKIFEILTESLESSEDESVYFDCMIRHSIDKKTLGSLIEKRSLPELQAALEELVKNGVYTKKELLETCFLPFVNSIDLVPVFNKMTVVEIEDVVLTRLQVEDYAGFIKRILKNCSSNADVKKELLSHLTISELTSNIIRKGSQKEIISSFTYMFLSADKDKEDLVQIFKLVSDSLVDVLPPSKLMELSIEFQKKIPIRD